MNLYCHRLFIATLSDEDQAANRILCAYQMRIACRSNEPEWHFKNIFNVRICEETLWLSMLLMNYSSTEFTLVAAEKPSVKGHNCNMRMHVAHAREFGLVLESAHTPDVWRDNEFDGLILV